MLVTVDHERKETHAIAKGEITIAEICSHLSEEKAKRGLGYREWIDASEATMSVSSDDIRMTVNLLKELGRNYDLGPTAIIVSNDVVYGMLRMLEILVDDVCEIRPFRTTQKAEAEQWLASAPIARAKEPNKKNTT